MRKQLGFTLLEIIIALFVFSIVSIIVVGALHNVLSTQSAAEKKTARLEQLQIALLFISRDIEQTIHRPILNAGENLEGFRGSPKIVTFTHAGLVNPLGQFPRSTLQRTRYQLNNKQLLRITWPVLDQVKTTKPISRTLLTGVSELDFAYLDNKNHFQTIWPPLDQPNAVLPRAVRVTLTLENWGKITQLFIIAGQPGDKAN